MKLRIFDGDAIMAHLNKRGSNGLPLKLLCVAPILSIAVACAVYGRLTQPNLIHLLCADSQGYLSALNRYCPWSASSASMSLFRDIPTLLCLILLSLTPLLMYTQWTSISCFLENMGERGLVAYPNGEGAIRNHVDRANAFFARWGRRTPYVMFGSVGCVLLLVRASQKGEVFWPLRTSGSAINYPDWWASFQTPSVIWMLYVAWATVFVYSVVLQNIYGGRIVLLAWQMRRDIQFSADPDSIDGVAGWSEVSTILRCTWVALMIHGASLGLLLLSIPRGTAYFLTPLLLQWIVAVPAFVLIPILVIRRNISRWQSDELKSLEEEEKRAKAANKPRGHLHQRAEKVRRLNVYPLSRISDRGLAIFGTVSTLLIVYNAVVTVYIK